MRVLAVPVTLDANLRLRDDVNGDDAEPWARACLLALRAGEDLLLVLLLFLVVAERLSRWEDLDVCDAVRGVDETARRFVEFELDEPEAAWARPLDTGAGTTTVSTRIFAGSRGRLPSMPIASKGLVSHKAVLY